MKIKAWIKAFRLRTLPLAIAIILAGTAISIVSLYVGSAYPAAILWKMPDPNTFMLTLLTTLFLQILSNLANDYGDFSKGTDNHDRVGPARALQSGGITKKEMLRAILLFSALSFISGIGLLYYVFGTENIQALLAFVGIGVLCIVGAITYTVGKKAYGYHALGDVGVLVFFGGVGVIGTSYLQLPLIDKIAVFTAIAYGMWATAVLNLNNMRDVDNDIVHGKKTLAYILGFNGAKVYQSILVIAPYVFQYVVLTHYITDAKALLALVLLPASLLLLVKTWQVKERKGFDKFLKFQALLTLANSIVLFSCIYLHAN